MFVLGTHSGGLLSNCLAYSPDSRLLASGSADEVRIWDLVERREKAFIDPNLSVSSVAFALDGTLVVSGAGEHAVSIFDPVSGQELSRRFPYDWCRAQCALLARDGNTLLCGGHHHQGAGGKVGRLLRWNVHTGRARKSVEDVQEDLGFLSESPDGRYLAGGGEEHSAWLWDQSTRKLLHTFSCRSRGWRVVAFSPDGQRLAITAGKNTEVWSPRSLERSHILRGHRKPIWGMAFTPDGRLVTGSDDGSVRLWDPSSGRQLASLDFGIGGINNVAVAPDGMTAAASGKKGTLAIWDLEAV